MGTCGWRGNRKKKEKGGDEKEGYRRGEVMLRELYEP